MIAPAEAPTATHSHLIVEPGVVVSRAALTSIVAA